MGPRSGSAQRAGVPAAAPLPVVERRLRATYPEARTALAHRSAFELLVATVLSAQATDAAVNAVTGELFRRWPDAPALADAAPALVEAVIRPVGLAPTKSRRIVALAQALRDGHQGEVPDDQDRLEELPGVGRKTASVVRGVWFRHSLLAVDTHVGRLSRRLGWTAATDPVRVESDVVARADTGADLTALSLRLILHGREVCHARRPACSDCVLGDVCPSAGSAA